jgi:hypothetical protein
MSRSIVLKSFAELAEVFDLGDPPQDPIPEVADRPAATGPTGDPAAGLADLLAELEAASAALATAVHRDREERASALRDLERYDALVVQQREAERASERARQVRLEAEALAEGAFAEEARAEAGRVADMARQAEATAAGFVDRWRRQAELLAAQLDLERLLAERRRHEAAEKARAAAAERAGRLSGALARARAALEAGRFEEARKVLGSAASESPNHPEIASLTEMIAQRERAVKVAAAEEVLWTVRRAFRRDPATAVARLEAVDAEGLPEPLAREVFGEWARACARLCRERGIAEPLRYAPDPGRGAVIAREGAGGGCVVVSALGMGAGWQAGSAVSERQVRRARPLR